MDITAMKYAEFVSFLGINTPPGGVDTVQYWIKHAEIDSSSELLDLACNTGFSSRTICERTNCKGEGIDISEQAISKARKFAKINGMENNLQYITGDARALPYPDQRFSHIIAGCTFGFIEEKHSTLLEVNRVLNQKGFLCVSNFHYHSEPPEKLLDRVETVIDFRPDKRWNKQFWQKLFKDHFCVKAEKTGFLEKMSDEAIEEKCTSYVEKSINHKDPNVINDCIERLINTRKILNIHRNYQEYSMAVLVKKSVHDKPTS